MAIDREIREKLLEEARKKQKQYKDEQFKLRRATKKELRAARAAEGHKQLLEAADKLLNATRHGPERFESDLAQLWASTDFVYEMVSNWDFAPDWGVGDALVEVGKSILAFPVRIPVWSIWGDEGLKYLDEKWGQIWDPDLRRDPEITMPTLDYHLEYDAAAGELRFHVERSDGEPLTRAQLNEIRTELRKPGMATGTAIDFRDVQYDADHRPYFTAPGAAALTDAQKENLRQGLEEELGMEMRSTPRPRP